MSKDNSAKERKSRPLFSRGTLVVASIASILVVCCCLAVVLAIVANIDTIAEFLVIIANLLVLVSRPF